jgi:hypothetical protein
MLCRFNEPDSNALECAKSVGLMYSSVPGISGRRLQNVLNRYRESVNVFTCIGSHKYFSLEIAALRELKWIEESLSEGNKSAACLLVDAANCNVVELNEWLDGRPGIELVLIHAETGTKKTPYLAILERLGFHIVLERGRITLLKLASHKFTVMKTGLRLDSHEIRLVLLKSWRRIRNLDSSTSVDLLSVNASLLLVPDRFDIAIKALYGRLWQDKRAEAFRDYAYFENLLRITGPGNEIDELDGSGKSGIEQFRAAFHSLLINLKPGDIPAVPIDTNWCAFDGAHRIASAIVMNREVQVARIDQNSKSRADASFLSGKAHGHPPCPTEILDEAAIEYCRIKDGLVLALIFPAVVSERFAIEQLKKIGRTVYRKDIALSSEAGAALLRQAYLGHAWTEAGLDNPGFADKVKSCFPFGGTVRAILMDGCDPRDIRPTKDCIRAHYGNGNHSIHLTDGDDEVLRLARVLFNKNSIDLLEAGVGQLPGFEHKLFAYRDWLETNALDEEAFCIAGSAVLSLLGLRECRDLDFLFHGDPSMLPATPARIDCHNDLASLYGRSIADMVGDPRLHCWYMGIKFCTPKVVLEMKEMRREIKDLSDAAMLRSKLPVEHGKAINYVLINANKINGNVRAGLAALIRSLKKMLRPFLQKIKCFLVKRN